MMDRAGMLLFAHPVMLADDGVQVHVNDVPVTSEVILSRNAMLLQMAVFGGALVTCGVGFTYIVYTAGAPMHVLVEGVMV